MDTRMWLRIVATLTILIGLIMFLDAVIGFGIAASFKTVLQIFHALLGLALIGLYESSLAKRKGILTVNGRQLGWFARFGLTAALLIGFYLLFTRGLDFLGGYTLGIWVHAIIALVSVGLTEMVFSRRRVTT